MQQHTLCFVKHFKQFLSVANCLFVRMMTEGGLKWWYGSWIMCCVWELFVLHTRGWVGGWVRVTRVELLFVLCTLDIWVSQWASADSRRWACSQTSQGRNCQFTKFSLLESLKVTVCLFISANVLLGFKQKLPRDGKLTWSQAFLAARKSQSKFPLQFSTVKCFACSREYKQSPTPKFLHLTVSAVFNWPLLFRSSKQ